MTTALAPSPTRAVRSATGNVRKLQGQLQHAWEVYVAQVKRAEAEYMERVKRATDAFSTADAPATPVNGEAPVSAA